MGYHAYQTEWTPRLNEVVLCCMEPNNSEDKYAVAVKKGEKVVGHLPKGTNGKFAKMIFYFLRKDNLNRCSCKVIGKPVNLGKGMGMQVPCTTSFTGNNECLDILKKCL